MCAQGTASATFAALVQAAPGDAQLFDVLGHCFKTSAAVGIPPNVASLPCRALLLSAFHRFVELRPGKPVEDAGRKAAMEQWRELSELLVQAVGMMLQRAGSELQ